MCILVAYNMTDVSDEDCLTPTDAPDSSQCAAEATMLDAEHLASLNTENQSLAIRSEEVDGL